MACVLPCNTGLQQIMQWEVLFLSSPQHVQMYKCFPGCYSPFFYFASYINQIVFNCLVDWLNLILRNSIMYISLALRSYIYYGYIQYLYIIQHRDRRQAPLSSTSLSSILSWDITFSCESTAFTSIPPRRLMW